MTTRRGLTSCAAIQDEIRLPTRSDVATFQGVRRSDSTSPKYPLYRAIRCANALRRRRLRLHDLPGVVHIRLGGGAGDVDLEDPTRDRSVRADRLALAVEARVDHPGDGIPPPIDGPEGPGEGLRVARLQLSTLPGVGGGADLG